RDQPCGAAPHRKHVPDGSASPGHVRGDGAGGTDHERANPRDGTHRAQAAPARGGDPSDPARSDSVAAQGPVHGLRGEPRRAALPLLTGQGVARARRRGKAAGTLRDAVAGARVRRAVLLPAEGKGPVVVAPSGEDHRRAGRAPQRPPSSSTAYPAWARCRLIASIWSRPEVSRVSSTSLSPTRARANARSCW